MTLKRQGHSQGRDAKSRILLSVFSIDSTQAVLNLAEMKFFSQALGMAGTNFYLFVDEESNKAVLFDAPEQTWELLEQAKQEMPFELEALYLTHGHWDHMWDASKFSDAGVPVYGHSDDKELFENAEAQRSFLAGGNTDLSSVKIDHWIEVGQPLTILGNEVEVRHVPGHCPGNVLFYMEAMKLAVVGDTIFAGSIGRIDLPGGSMEVLEQSIRTQIYTLPDETQLLSGHGPATTVGQEKATNPYVPGVV